MRINGETMIFKNEYGYSTTISNKKQDGTYENMTIPVQFKKDDVEAQNIPTKTKINIKNGFLTFYIGKVGNEETKKVKAMILDYEIVEKKEEDNYQDPFVNIENEDSALLNDDELPF